MAPSIAVNKTAEELTERLATLFSTLLAEKSGHVFVGVSGGSMIDILARVLPRFASESSRLRLLLVDERVVPITSSDSLLGEYNRKLAGNAHILDFQRPEDLSQVKWASAYENFLRSLSDLPIHNGLPRFDVVLLGIGEDGHTASLFPGRDLSTTSWIVPVSDSPKPPPSRISFSLPVLSNSTRVIFIATGAGKTAILKRIFAGDKSLPSALVRSASGDPEFFVDEPAAAHL